MNGNAVQVVVVVGIDHVFAMSDPMNEPNGCLTDQHYCVYPLFCSCIIYIRNIRLFWRVLRPFRIRLPGRLIGRICVALPIAVIWPFEPAWRPLPCSWRCVRCMCRPAATYPNPTLPSDCHPTDDWYCQLEVPIDERLSNVCIVPEHRHSDERWTTMSIVWTLNADCSDNELDLYLLGDNCPVLLFIWQLCMFRLVLLATVSVFREPTMRRHDAYERLNERLTMIRVVTYANGDNVDDELPVLPPLMNCWTWTELQYRTDERWILNWLLIPCIDVTAKSCMLTVTNEHHYVLTRLVYALLLTPVWAGTQRTWTRYWTRKGTWTIELAIEHHWWSSGVDLMTWTPTPVSDDERRCQDIIA